MVVHFQTTYAAVDWMVRGSNVGCILAAAMVAWLALIKMIMIKDAMIANNALLQTVNLLRMIVGFYRIDSFGLVMFGQVLGRIATAIV